MKNESKTNILIGGIRVSPDAPVEEVLKRAKDKMKRAGISTSTLHFQLYKKSIDARKRNDVRLEYTVLAESEKPQGAYQESQLKRADARFLVEKTLVPQYGTDRLQARPLVVGMGPAGLFAAYLLAQNGYRPILIERGAAVEERVADVARFRECGILNTESNIQFGAGGAGTFSDGKLVTRIHDERCGFVLQTLFRFGAPEEILTKAKPHVGTDVLRRVVSSMLADRKSVV